MQSHILDIFVGNEKYFNFGIPKVKKSCSEKIEFEYSKFPISDLKNKLDLHTKGLGIIGLIPIISKLYCNFGVIDIDVYKDVDYKELYTFAKNKKGFLFKSKSGGYHIWFFSKLKIEAFVMRDFLERIAKEIKYEYEIFPKQNFLTKGTGNSINLPFFNNNKSYYNGVDWSDFTVFENEFTYIDINKENIDNKEKELPKCIQYLLENLGAGNRHNVLVNLCVFLRLKYTNEIQAKETLETYYSKYFNSVNYSLEECLKTFTNVFYSEVFYQCNGFLKNFCIGKQKCKEISEFGIGRETNEDVNFVIDKLTQYKNPNGEDSFILKTGGHEIHCPTFKDLWSYKLFKLKAIEQLVGVYPPKMEQAYWEEEILKDALNVREIVEYKEDDNFNELLQIFKDWISLNAISEDETDFLTSGVFYNKTKEIIYFSLIKFKQHLIRKKFKDKNLTLLKKLLFDLIEIKRTTIIDNNKKPINCYSIDFESINFSLPISVPEAPF